MASVQQRVWKEIPHLKTRKYFCSRLIFTFLNIFGNLVSGAKVTSSHHRWGDCTIGDSDKCISPQSPVLYLTHLEFTHGSNTECPESLQILSKRRTKFLPSFFPWGNQAGFYTAFYCQSPWSAKNHIFALLESGSYQQTKVLYPTCSDLLCFFSRKKHLPAPTDHCYFLK